MKRFASLLFVIAMALGGASVSAGAGAFGTLESAGTLSVNRNSITGFIFNDAREPLADVHVELLDELYVTISRTKTSGSGLYSFRGLADGRYVVKVIPYGIDYEEQSRSIPLISVSALPGSGAVAEQADFYLRPKKNVNAGPLAAPGVIFVQDIPENAKKLYEAGIEDLAGKKENEGFDKLKRCLEIFPNYFAALDRLGREYVVRGYYQASFVLFTKAIEVNPRSFSSTFGLGLSAFRLNQIKQSTDLFRRATEIDNKQVNGFLWLGISYFQDKEYAQAETVLNKAKKLSEGKSADVSWQLARVYKEQKLYAKAADELDAYLLLSPDSKNKEEVKKMIQILRQKQDGN